MNSTTSLVSSPTKPSVPAEPSGLAVDKTHDHFYSRAFVLATIVLLGLALYKITLPFMEPLVWALFLAFLLHPLHLRLTRRLNGHENASASLLLITTFVILVGPVTMMSIAFIAQISDLVQWLQEILGKQSQEQYQVLDKLPFVEPVLQWVRNHSGIQTSQMEKWLAQGTSQLPPFLGNMSRKIFMGIINMALSFMIMLFMLFFFLRDGAEFVAMFRDMIPMIPKRREQLMIHIASVMRAVVFGSCFTVFSQGILIGIAFWIAGLDSPLVFGLLAALAALLPYGGTALLWIPAMLFLIDQDHWNMALLMLTAGIMSLLIDHIARPLLISNSSNIGMLAVFIGVLGGVIAFGPIGLFIGPVVLALIIALMRFALEIRHADCISPE